MSYEEVVQKAHQEISEKRLKNSLWNASRVRPEEHVEDLELAKTHKLPIETVKRNKPEIKQRNRLTGLDLDSIRKEAPKLASYLEDPNNAAIAFDDIPTLIEYEKNKAAGGFFKRRANDIRRGGLAVKRMIETIRLNDEVSFGAEIKRVINQKDEYSGRLVLPPAHMGIASKFLPDVVPEKGLKEQILALDEEGLKELERNINKVQLRTTADVINTTGRMLEIPKGSARRKFDESEGYKAGLDAFTDAPIEVAASLGVESLTQMAPLLPILGAPAGWAGMGGYSFTQRYSGKLNEFIMSEGIDFNDKEAVIALLSNEEKMNQFRKDAAKAGISGAAVDALSVGVAGKLTAAMKTPVKTATAATAETLVIQPALGGAAEFASAGAIGELPDSTEVLAEVFGGSITAIPEVAGGVYQARQMAVENKFLREVASIIESEGEQQVINDALDKVKSTKLNQLSKESLKEYLDSVSEETVYISPEGIEELIGSDAPLPEALLYHDPVTGADMPLSDFATKIPEDVQNVLRPHIRLSNETKTQAELSDNPSIAKIVDRAVKNEEIEKESRDIYNEIKDQLISTGTQSPLTAKYSAEVIPAYIATRAEKYGISPKQIYEDMGLTIKKAGEEPEGVTIPQMKYNETQDFQGLALEEEVEIEETGDKVKLKESPEKLYNTHVKRRKMAKKLLDCING
jgi:hypothetical protein